MKRYLLCVLLLIPWPAWAAELAGSATAKVGEVVSIAVGGEPAFDGTKTVADNITMFQAWLASTRFQCSAPDGAAYKIETRTVLVLEAGGIVPETTIQFAGDKPGTYVIAALIPPELALHRVQVGGAPDPPPKPDDPDPPEPPSNKVTQATYVYEKDQNNVPRPVSSALQKLNSQGILATVFEEDSLDGDGDVPERYQIALQAAQQAGLPALVIQAGATVVRVVKTPATEASVLEAVKP